MYIVAIGWMYVVILMAATEPSLVGALLTLWFYGLLPLALLLWLFGAPRRRRRRLTQRGENDARKPDGSDAQRD